MIGTRRTGIPLMVDGERVDGLVTWDAEGPSFELPGSTMQAVDVDAAVIEAGETMLVLHEGRQTKVEIYDPTSVDLEHLDDGGIVKAPMHGKVVALFVAEGDVVEKGQRVAIVEAMKMEHVMLAPAAGTVAEILAETGQQVPENKPQFEYNAEHPLVARLDAEADEDRFAELVLVLFDQARLAGGLAVPDA
jgi:3-methylcrotonyl-CoA carboxylase alpha subunit